MIYSKFFKVFFCFN